MYLPKKESMNSYQYTHKRNLKKIKTQSDKLSEHHVKYNNYIN